MDRQTLAVITYHYVRQTEGTRFPGIKGLSIDQFCAQVQALRERYEMATVESSLSFLAGRYRPRRSLCLLTFDDGLKEHHATVLPILHAHGIQGAFFITTGCLDGRVAAVHKNHHLLASVEFDTYRRAFMGNLSEADAAVMRDVDVENAYPWDPPEVRSFKFLVNYQLPPERSDQILSALFEQFIGDEREFAKELYLTWQEAREMQSAGMLIGGHSHDHRVLSSMNADSQSRDLATCFKRLTAELQPQPLWPFSYPYGRFDAATVEILQSLGFACSFALEGGSNNMFQPTFRIRRIDTKDLVFT